MQLQLIFKEEDVRGLFPWLSNVSGEYLATAMFEAQEIDFKRIVGTAMLNALKAHEIAGDWAQYPDYAELRDRAFFFLSYKTIQYVIPKVSYKIGNIGVVQTSDQNVQNLSREQIDANKEEYESRADSFCYELQCWLLENIGKYPELGNCDAIRSNLYSAASCGIWLGGARGQI